MKNLMFTVLFAVLSLAATAQCDKKATAKATTGYFVQDGNKQQGMPFDASLTFSKDKIVITINMSGQSMTVTNTITETVSCEWKSFLKDGKAVYKASANKGTGDVEPTTIRINGKDGKTTIYFGNDPDTDGGLELELTEIKVEE
ncbi:MAG: hypothetical protein ABW019_05315 [Chitinophagaceae bacterium]